MLAAPRSPRVDDRQNVLEAMSPARTDHDRDFIVIQAETSITWKGDERSAITPRAFDFLETNDRPPKPRQRGLTEIREPYYSPMGKRYLQDVLETMAAYIDSLKFAGGSFCLFPRAALQELLDLCHQYDVLVSTGGFIEYVLTQSRTAVDRYIRECKDLGFDIIEISSGFITLPTDDWLRLVEKVQQSGLKAKPEVGIQFGSGGASAVGELAGEGSRDPALAISQAKRFLDAGVPIVMIESEGIELIAVCFTAAREWSARQQSRLNRWFHHASSRPCTRAGGDVASIAVKDSSILYECEAPLGTTHESPGSSSRT